MQVEEGGRQPGRRQLDAELRAELVEAELVEAELVRTARALLAEHERGEGISSRCVHELEVALWERHRFERWEGA